MIIKVNLNDAMLLTIGVTDQMAKDFKECKRKSETGENVDCNQCSWDKLTFNSIPGCETGACELEVVEEAISGNQCVGCFGAANGDCDDCPKDKRFGSKIIGETMRSKNETRKYTIDQILDVIEKTDREIVIAIMRYDRRMLKDVLQRFLH